MKLKGLSTNTVYIGLTILFILFQLFFITRVPDIMEDEPWYANTAYNFSVGNWFTNTNTGHQGGDTFIVYTFILGIAVKLFGCTLLVTRLVSVLAGIIAMWGIISILKILKISRLLALLTLLMFIFSNVIYVVFRTTRPESWILAFGIWSIYYLLEFHTLKQSKQVIWCSVFSVLSFLTHPNGMLFLMIAGIYLILYSYREKNISNLLRFGIIAFVVIIIHYVVVFLNPNIHLKEFITDLKMRNSITENNITLTDNFKDFFSSYTLGIKRLYILIFEIGVLVFGLFYFRKEKIILYLAFFGLFNLVFSLLFYSPYSSRHFGEIIVFSLLSYALITQYTDNKRIKLLFIAMGILYLGNNAAGDLYLLYNKHNNTPYKNIEKELSEIVPDNSVVMASLHFWYPFKTCDFYNEYTSWINMKKYKSLDELIESGNVDYIVVNPSLIEGKTCTSGRNETVPFNTKNFYDKTTSYASAEGELIYTLKVTTSDTLRVYKMKE